MMREAARGSMRPGARRPRRERAQSIVEFGLIVTIFFFLIMGIFDYGMLMHAWLKLSAGSASLARHAAVGTAPTTIVAMGQKVVVPGSAASPQLKLQALVRCSSGCWDTAAADDWRDIDLTQSTFVLVSPYTYVNGPYAGQAAPKPGALLRVVLSAPQFSVVTPVVRTAFGCPGSDPACYVPLSSTTTVRFEGIFIQ